MISLLAAIPPPPFSTLDIGPLQIRMYGLMIGLGVLAGVRLCGRLMGERDVGTVDDAAMVAVWGVLAGIVGARFYHVVTDFDQYRGNLGEAWKVWRPGLGIPGGVLFGTLAGVFAAKRRGLPVLAMMSCAAPGIALAQSIGRWGNYFNQELFGRPTTLPWGLRLDPQFIPAGYSGDTLFHPTFLYESLWNAALCVGLVWLFHHRPRLQPGRLFPLYLVGYGLGRLWIEALRIDPANRIGPFRTNIWMSLVLVVGGSTWFILTRRSTARWPEASVDTDGASPVADIDTAVEDPSGEDRDDEVAEHDDTDRSPDTSS